MEFACNADDSVVLMWFTPHLMAGTGLFQQQSLKQVIGPQMQQSLQILQAPAMELRQIPWQIR